MTVGNVFSWPAVQQIMCSMLEYEGHWLKGGAVVLSRTVAVEGYSEFVIAGSLEAVAEAYTIISLGNYPF